MFISQVLQSCRYLINLLLSDCRFQGDGCNAPSVHAEAAVIVHPA
ncbi:MAG TPA: hypothetical protein PK580_01085 [Nitrosomonas halophila]|nr:hypothetical protein [Nitrosomonas halophila]